MGFCGLPIARAGDLLTLGDGKQIRKQVRKELKNAFAWIDWAEDATYAAVSGGPIPIKSGGVPTIDKILEDYLAYLEKTAATADSSMPVISPLPSVSPVQNDPPSQVRDRLRSAVRTLVSEAKEAVQLEDYIRELEDWKDEVASSGDMFRRVADTYDRVYLAYPEYTGKLKLGITTFNLVQTADQAGRYATQVETTASRLKRELSPLRTMLIGKRDSIRSALKREQSLIETQSNKLRMQFDDIDRRTRHKEHRQLELQNLRREVATKESQRETVMERVDSLEGRIETTERELERLRPLMREESRRSDEPFQCPAGHTEREMNICEDVGYKEGRKRRRQTAIDNLRNYSRQKQSLDTTLSNTKMALKADETELDRLEREVEAGNRTIASWSTELNQITEQLAVDRDAFLKEMYTSKATVFMQESKADETNLNDLF